MSRRGDNIVTIALVLAIASMVGSFALAATSDSNSAVFMMAFACFMLLVAVYLEVYSHRG